MDVALKRQWIFCHLRPVPVPTQKVSCLVASEQWPLKLTVVCSMEMVWNYFDATMSIVFWFWFQLLLMIDVFVVILFGSFKEATFQPNIKWWWSSSCDTLAQRFAIWCEWIWLHKGIRDIKWSDRSQNWQWSSRCWVDDETVCFEMTHLSTLPTKSSLLNQLH